MLRHSQYMYILLAKRIDTFCFRGISTFWAQKIILDKLAKFTKIFELHQVFMYNILCQNIWIFRNYILLTRRINKVWDQNFWTRPSLHMSQNVLIPPNHMLPTCTKSIFTPSTNFWHFLALSVKVGSISLFSSCDMHQSHRLVGCNATGINSLFISFWYTCFALCLFII